MARSLCLAVGFALAAAPIQAQTFNTLHTFTGTAEGTRTAAPLMQASDGLFYGVNLLDGPNGAGTLFRMTPNGTLTVMHAFAGAVDGARPGSELIQARDGHLYGTTNQGGPSNSGVVFRFTLAGELTVVHAFGGTPQSGGNPGTLLQSASGDFYGTTCNGGENGSGTVFRMTEAGDVTTIYSFTDGAGGRCPGSLLLATDGMFYGTASGGSLGIGIAFRLTPAGVFTNLHDFVRTVEGGSPGPLMQSKLDGMLYGTTRGGGLLDFSSGILYRLSPAGAFNVVYGFGTGGAAGAFPAGRLVEGTDGNFYGVTEHGGRPYSYYTSTGTVFRVTRTGVHTPLRLLYADFDGMNPETGLVQGMDGHLYGAASNGGFYGYGTLFRLATYLCTNTVDATYNSEFQSLGLTFRFQSSGAGTWNVWAIDTAGVTPLWSVPIGPVSLPTGFPASFTVPPRGPLVFVTTLTVPGYGSCGGWAYVDTGTPAAPAVAKK